MATAAQSTTVLVTGATGFIGSRLVECLVAGGVRVRCLVRPTSNLRGLANLPIERVYGDLADGSDLGSALEGIEIVYHLAGVVNSRTAEGYWRGNVTATENLVKACLSADPPRRVVHVSSLAAAGPSQPGCPLSEGDPPRPVSVYGRSKLRGEQVIWGARDRLRVTIIRPPVVYGPGDRALLPLFRAARRGFAPSIGRRERWLSVVYVDDLVQGILLAGAESRAAGQIYYLADESIYTWHDVAYELGRVYGVRVRQVPVPEAVCGVGALVGELVSHVTKQTSFFNRDKITEACQPAWTCKIEKAKRELGFQPLTDMAIGFGKTAEWYRGMGWV